MTGANHASLGIGRDREMTGAFSIHQRTSLPVDSPPDSGPLPSRKS